MYAWLSMIPVVGDSRIPMSARTNGSSLAARERETNSVGTPSSVRVNLCSLTSSSHSSFVWATIHLPMLEHGMEYLAHRAYIRCRPRMQRVVFSVPAP